MNQAAIDNNNGGGLRAASQRRAALYMRVSTKGHGQTTETQALALRDYGAHRGFEVIQEYRDEGISGSKDSRPALDRLMKDARARKFDVVIVARFDRFARSVSHLLRALEEKGAPRFPSLEGNLNPLKALVPCGLGNCQGTSLRSRT